MSAVMTKTKDSLDELFEEVQVEPLYDTAEVSLEGWYGVSTAHAGGFIAYFRDEEAATHFQLSLINAALNPGLLNSLGPGASKSND